MKSISHYGLSGFAVGLPSLCMIMAISLHIMKSEGYLAWRELVKAQQ